MSHHELIRGDSFRSSVRGFVLVGLMLVAETAAAGPTFVVNSLADVPAGPNLTDQICETATGNGICTLRAAIMEANATLDAVVRVPAGIYALTRPDTGVGPGGAQGDLDVIRPMKIEGDGPSVSIIDATALSRVFYVAPSNRADLVEMRGLTIQNGLTTSTAGGIYAESGTLLLENVHLTENIGGLAAGLVASDLTMRRSVVNGNSCISTSGTDCVGGLYLGGDVLIGDSRIEGNSSSDGPGGIWIARGANARIEGTAIIKNRASLGAGVGGGIYSAGTLTVVNSLISQNRGSYGSALFVANGPTETTDLIHVTVTDNGSLVGGALFNNSAHPISLRRSIVRSSSGGGCLGEIFSGDYNIIDSPASCPMTGLVAHNISIGGPGGFGVLSFNGGFSRDVSSAFTVASGAVPAGACLDELGAPLTTDFRGYRRPSSACDIGAHDSGALGYKPAQLIGVNLLRNGGKTGQELGLANTTLAEDMQPPYWDQAGVVLHRLYGPGFPSLNDTPPGNGHKFLSGWLENATANQTIDVSALAGQIDAGAVAYQVGGSFGGKSTENDNAAMTVLFYSDGFGFLDAFNLGGFTAADRGNQTKLMRAQRNGTLPVGTRLIQVGVSFTRTDGFTNEAFADGLSVALPEPDIAAGLGTALIALAGIARSRRSRLA